MTVPPPPPPPPRSSPPSAAPSPVARGARRTGLLIAGTVVLVAALVSAVTCAIVARVAQNAAVADLARAASGCTTTIDVVEPGTYAVFLESRGRLRGLSGGCPFPEGRFRSFATSADVELSVTGDDDGTASVRRVSGNGYDLGDRVGARIASLDVSTPGRLELTVTSGDERAVVAIGIDPSDVARPWLVGAGAVLIVGVLVGGLLLAVGLRRRPVPSITAIGDTGVSNSGPWGPPRL